MEVVKKVEIFIEMSWPFGIVDNDQLQGGQAYFHNHMQLLCTFPSIRNHECEIALPIILL